ncbi:MAG: acylphosphatase [Dehalococcoidia bacterium]
MSEAFEAVVSGRVQGVGYRDYARRRARQLGISGWVRNLPDGRVEVHAEGARESLDTLLRQLRSGPNFGRVNDITVAWTAPSGLEDFSIRRDADA